MTKFEPARLLYRYNTSLWISQYDPVQQYTDWTIIYSTNPFETVYGYFQSTNQSINKSVCVLETYLDPTVNLNFDYSLGSEQN